MEILICRLNSQTTLKHVQKEAGRDLEANKRLAEKTDRVAEEEQHRARVAELDSQKFSVARGIHDEEKLLESLESRMRKLGAELAQLKAEEDIENDLPPDAAA